MNKIDFETMRKVYDSMSDKEFITKIAEGFEHCHRVYDSVEEQELIFGENRVSNYEEFLKNRGEYVLINSEFAKYIANRLKMVKYRL